MIKNYKNKIVFALLVVLGGCNPVEKSPFDKVIENWGRQLKIAITQSDTLCAGHKGYVLPVSYNATGEISMVQAGNRFNDSFSGKLWLMYEITDDKFWEAKAREFTKKLNIETHDTGFRILCGYGNGYRLTNDSGYREVLLQAAKALMTHYNEKVGCIRSLCHNADSLRFSVAIDNIMDLELLFWATKETGSPIYKEAAVNHAIKIVENHFRDDSSSWQVVDYNPATGEVQNKATRDGYADESTLSRGQAWALYGFTMVYRETGMHEFLQEAEKIAQFIINHPRMPEDMVPYRDFDAPGIPEEPRDVTAAAIIASGLFELAGYTESKEKYLTAANKILSSLCSDAYLPSSSRDNGGSMSSFIERYPPDMEADKPMFRIDYFLIEAGKRKLNIN